VTDDAAVDLYWIPLGAGASVVRASGATFEAIMALAQHRPRGQLYHSALVVTHEGDRYAIEMTPEPDGHGREQRGVVAGGAVGTAVAARFRPFRYEIRRWPGGVIPDLGDAVASPVRVSTDPDDAAHVIALVPQVPTPVWGRDALHTGEMWNSNSVTSWLLARAGLATGGCEPPVGGRAPGWNAGLVASRLGAPEPVRVNGLRSVHERVRVYLRPVAPDPGDGTFHVPPEGRT